MRTLQEKVAQATVIVLDFDDTIAMTSEPNPDGLTVERAYELALEELFPAEENLLRKLGGLRNRAPVEIAQAILDRQPHLYLEARNFYDANRGKLAALVPQGKGVDLELARSHGDDLGLIAELITLEKLSHLVDAIGTCGVGGSAPIWPPLAPGFGEFIGTWESRPWGLLTSGHDIFITRTFFTWRVEPPKHMLTDDDMRGSVGDHERRVKPHPDLMDRLRRKMERTGIDWSRPLYIGNDPRKDGDLAANAGVDFACYNPSEIPLPEGMQEFRHYRELTEALLVAA